MNFNLFLLFLWIESLAIFNQNFTTLDIRSILFGFNNWILLSLLFILFILFLSFISSDHKVLLSCQPINMIDESLLLSVLSILISKLIPKIINTVSEFVNLSINIILSFSFLVFEVFSCLIEFSLLAFLEIFPVVSFFVELLVDWSIFRFSFSVLITNWFLLVIKIIKLIFQLFTLLSQRNNSRFNLWARKFTSH